jgi:hypothetical protein
VKIQMRRRLLRYQISQDERVCVNDSVDVEEGKGEVDVEDANTHQENDRDCALGALLRGEVG